MLRRFLVYFLLLSVGGLFGQPTATTLSLNDCYQQAEASHPLGIRKGLQQQLTAVQSDYIRKQSLPQLEWIATGSIQTENLNITLPLPGVESIEVPIYKAQTYLEGNYLLLDGGMKDARLQQEQAKLVADMAMVDQQLYSVKEQVNGPFFQVLMLQSGIDILEATKDQLNIQLDFVKAAVKNGVMLEGEQLKLEAEQLRLHSKQLEMESQIRSMLVLLENLTSSEIGEDWVLELPELPHFHWELENKRPEYKALEAQKQQLLSQEAIIEAGSKPKLGVFAQAGAGYPNPLNFFETELSPYALGGVRFSWKIPDWGKTQKQKDLLMVQAQLLENQRGVLDYQFQVLEGTFQEEIVRLTQQLEQDRALLQLQQQLTEQLEAQLKGGVITATEYLIQLQTMVQTELQMKAREIQIQKVKVDYLIHKGWM
jgi:outer membrane protein TolC